MKFSIIIPVYKVELYLRKCVQSVLSQTYKDFEIILVDDGSPDGCPALCDKLATEDDRIHVIHKQNGGASTARNEGLKHASGDYVVYMDSDDYWCDDWLLTHLKERISLFREEVVLFGCKIIVEDGSEETTRKGYNIELLNKHQKSETLRYLVASGKFPGAAWIMTVKRDLLNTLSLEFETGVTAEDFKWVITILAKCNAIGAIEGIHYAYVKRSGSVTSASRVSGIKGTAQAIDAYLELCNEQESVSELAPFICRIYLLALMSYSGLPTSDREEGARFLRKYLPILRQTEPFYFYIISVFGFFLTSQMVRLAYKIIRG